MATTVIEAAKAYSSQVVREPLNNSVFSILVNPNVFKYEKFGKETMVREIIGGTASNYDKNVGFTANGKGGSASWKSFVAPYDREMTFKVDAIDEYNAVLEGYELSGAAIAKQNMVGMGAEIDATTSAAIYANVPSANVTDSATAKVDKDNIFQTLTDIEAKVFNAGYTGDSYVFVRASVYSAIQAALLANNALANDEIVKSAPVKGVELETRVIKYNNLILIRVPDNRMFTAVTLLDGKSEGQENGGYVKGDGASYIDVLVVPAPAAALSVRHFVANLLVPMSYMNGLNPGTIETELGGVNNLTDGVVAFANIGINQKGDDFEYQTRMIYGAMTFDAWKKTLFAITTAIA